MKQEDVLMVIHRLREHGFTLRLSSAIAGKSIDERERNAARAAAALLYNVDADAFSGGQSWALINHHIATAGLARTIISLSEGRLNGLSAFEATAVTAALHLAAIILENSGAES